MREKREDVEFHFLDLHRFQARDTEDAEEQRAAEGKNRFEVKTLFALCGPLFLSVLCVPCLKSTAQNITHDQDLMLGHEISLQKIHIFHAPNRNESQKALFAVVRLVFGINRFLTWKFLV